MKVRCIKIPLKKVMSGRSEASIDLICDWLLDKRHENLKLNMHLYWIIWYNLFEISIGIKMIKGKSIK